MRIRLGYEIGITVNQPTPLVALMGVHPDRVSDIVWAETVRTEPPAAQRGFIDQFGNHCLRTTAPTGDFSMRFDAIVDDSGKPDAYAPDALEIPAERLPDDCLVYLLGSRYCETDHLGDLAWSLFGDVKPGWSRVQAICDHVHERLSFGYGYARATRTASQANDERVGVCRDFAHLAIALCRCMNIPARYVNGYMGDIGIEPNPSPMDFNAWFEAYLGGKWYTFDARHNVRRIGRVVVARGRDATDVPLLHSFGPHFLSRFQVWTYEEPEKSEQRQALKQPPLAPFGAPYRRIPSRPAWEVAF